MSSTASPLPTQLVPLLQEPLEKIKEVINKVLPVSKKRTALEEAEWEDEGSENALEREIMLQCMSFPFQYTSTAAERLTQRWRLCASIDPESCCTDLWAWAKAMLPRLPSIILRDTTSRAWI